MIVSNAKRRDPIRRSNAFPCQMFENFDSIAVCKLIVKKLGGELNFVSNGETSSLFFTI